jgi:hypothetical protein
MPAGTLKRRRGSTPDRRVRNAGVDCVAINAAGCGSAMKSYGDLLRDDRLRRARPRLCAKCVDVSELLADLEPRATRHPLPMRVAYHGACHLHHAQGVSAQPRDLLRSIPGIELREIPRPMSAADRPASTTCSSPIPPARLRDRKGAAPADDGRGGGGVRESGLPDADRIRPGACGTHDQDDASDRVGRSISSQ